MLYVYVYISNLLFMFKTCSVLCAYVTVGPHIRNLINTHSRTVELRI